MFYGSFRTELRPYLDGSIPSLGDVLRCVCPLITVFPSP